MGGNPSSNAINQSNMSMIPSNYGYYYYPKSISYPYNYSYNYPVTTYSYPIYYSSPYYTQKAAPVPGAYSPRTIALSKSVVATPVMQSFIL